MFAAYGVIGLGALSLYSRLSPAVEAPTATPVALGPSKGIVYRLTLLFALDSFGSGFFVQSMLALWLYQRFGLSVSTAAAIFFWASICSAVSFLIAVPVAKRFGLINTMVFTHLPANLFLMLLPFAPNLPIAIALLLARGSAAADGRADPDLVRDGGGNAGRAAGGGERNRGSAQPGRGREPVVRRISVRAVVVRLAIDHRRAR